MGSGRGGEGEQAGKARIFILSEGTSQVREWTFVTEIISSVVSINSFVQKLNSKTIWYILQERSLKLYKW